MSEIIQNSAGVEVTETAKKPKMNKKKKMLIITIAAVALIAAVAGVVAAVVLNSPKMLVARGIKNSAEAIQKSEAVALLTKTSENGSVGVSVGLDQFVGLPIDGRVNVKAYGSKGYDAAVTAGVEIAGSNLADACLRVSEDEIVIFSDVVLGDDAYGINLDNAAENYETSLFGPNGAFYFGVDSIDPILELIEASRNMEKDSEELYEELVEKLLESLNEHAEVEKENDTLDFNGKSTKVTVVKFVLDDDAFKDLLLDMVDYLRKSDKVEKFLEKYGNHLMGTSPLVAMIEYNERPSYYERFYGIETFDEYYEYFYGDDEGNVVDEFYDVLDEIKDSIDEIEGLKEIELAFYITKSGTQLVGFEIEVDTTEEDVKLGIFMGPDLSKMSELRVELRAGDNKAVLSYCVTTNDKSEYISELAVKADGETVLTGGVEWDKKNGDLEICVEVDGEELVLEGALEAGKSRAELQVDYIAVPGEGDMELDIVLTLDADDKMPAIPNDYTDILEMTEDDVKNLAEMLQDTVSGLLGFM